MRTMLFAVLVVGFTAVGGAQQAGAPKLNFLADSVQQDGEKVQLHGRVRLAACSVVTADDGVIDFGSYDATLSGNVHMKLTNGIDH